MKRYLWVINVINKVISALMVALLMMLIIVVFGQVLSRTFHFNAPILEELARYMNICLAFLAGAYGVRQNTLIKVDTLHMALKGKWKKIVVEISRMISLIFIVIMVYSSFLLVQLGIGQTTPALKFEMSYIYGIMMATFIMSILNWIAHSAEIWGGSK